MTPNASKIIRTGIVRNVASRCTFLTTGVLILTVAFSIDGKANDDPVREISQPKAMGILSVAQEAARNGMQELSFKAARAALGAGAPVPQHDPDTQSLTEIQESHLLRDHEIEAELRALTTLWREKQFDQNQVWQVLRDIVFPSTRPGEIFIYRGGDLSELLNRSVAFLTVQQAIASQTTTELASLLEGRLQHPAARLDAWEMLLALKMEMHDLPKALRQLESLDDQIVSNADPSLLSYVCLRLLHASRSRTLRDAAVLAMEPALSALAERSSSLGRELDDRILDLLIRQHLLRGDLGAANRCLALSDQLAEIRNDTREPDSMVLHHLQLAVTLLQFGRSAEAAKRLNLAVDLESESATESTRVASRLVTVVPYLAELEAKDRYPILRYCYFGAGRKTPMTPTLSFVGAEKPPASFAALLPQSNLAAGFVQSASVQSAAETEVDSSPVRMTDTIISSALMLIEAAVEANQIDQLETDLVKQKVHRSTLHLLALLFLASGQQEKAVAAVGELNEGLQTDLKKGNAVRSRDLALDLVVAMKAAEVSETLEPAIKMLETLSRIDDIASHGRIMSAANDARHHAFAKQADVAMLKLAQSFSPLNWTQSSLRETKSERHEEQHKSWLVHENFLSHQALSQRDFLYFPWPLQGEFEFSVPSFLNSNHGGGLAFDGLFHEIENGDGSSFVSGIGSEKKQRRSLHFNAANRFARTSVRVTADELSFMVNGHQVFSEERMAASSPWLMLHVGPHRRGLWQLPEFTGSPQIPREVRLSEDPRLRGWNAWYSRQTRPDIFISTLSNTADSDATKKSRPLDWSVEQGMIVSQAHPELFFGGQSLLQYNRPLMSGDRVSWEFEYSPESIVTHPAIGRVSFMLRPEGVALHWISLTQDEASLLPFDNELIVAESQRGPVSLPLQTGWNKATLSLRENVVTLMVNDTGVYQHALSDIDGRQFGLFHYRDQSEVRVRNVVLTGEWPEAVTPESLNSLLASRGDSVAPVAQQCMDKILGDPPFAATSLQIVTESLSMDAKSRYAFLQNWVLPADSHSTVRLWGDFLPGYYEIDVARDLDTETKIVDQLGSNPWTLHSTNAASPRRYPGGFVVAPAIQLVRAARELGQLQALRRQLNESLAEASQEFRIHKLAILFLVAVEEGDDKNATSLFGEIAASMMAKHELTEHELWPLLIFCQQAVNINGLHADSRKVLQLLSTKDLGIRKDLQTSVERYVASGISTLKLLETSPGSDFRIVPPTQWQSMRVLRADYQAAGLPEPVWHQHPDGTIQHVAGFEDDILCYPMPLTGNFEFQCELAPEQGSHLQVGYGGFFLDCGTDGRGLRKIPFARDAVVGPKIDGFVPQKDKVWTYRLVVSESKMEIFVDGNLLLSEMIAPSSPPWLCLRAASRPGASISKIQLRGEPTVPKSVAFDTNRNLEGWCRPFFGGGGSFAPHTRASSDWRSSEAVLSSSVRDSLVHTKTENLLQYFRPLMEDGVLTYSFYCGDDSTIVHPALDQVSFVLDKDRGVLLHKISNGKWSQFDVDPGKLMTPSTNQLATVLPLLRNDWNTMQIVLQDESVTLVLNDVPVFKQRRNSGRANTFGLFHWADETAVKVKDISWAGQWKVQKADFQ